MRMRGLILVSLLVLAGCAEEMPQPPVAAEPVANCDYISVESVRTELDWPPGCCGHVVVWSQAYLLDLGERAFPAYDVILADLKSKPAHVEAVCLILAEVEADRRRFVPLAVRRLTDPNAGISPKPLAHTLAQPRPYYWSVGLTIPPAVINECTRMMLNNREDVRDSVIELLGAIGDERDANVLVPFLSHNRAALRSVAAKALAKIGGWHELEAMKACVKASNVRRDANELRHLQECRDKLEARLKANPIPKHLTN
jgi:hypothetical protein